VTDTLIDMLARLGVGVRLVIKPAKAKKVNSKSAAD
jgi:hypothetical protein